MDHSIAPSKKLHVYNIDKYEYMGVDVFMLDGGMSAEYAVEKSLEALSSGVSHSWFTLPEEEGHGPRPVYATPEFLELSVKKTVHYYDEYLGEDTPFNTVIISSGVMPVAYFARVMGAPILPLQYLVSANSIKEIKAIAQYSMSIGIPCYITYGYDASMEGIGVAWCELLDIPDSYMDFIIRHKVKNVVFIGSTGVSTGETTARKVILGRDNADVNEEINAGDIYIMYPGVGSWTDKPEEDDLFESNEMLKSRISDYDDIALEKEFRHIGDWESGIEQVQIENFTRKIKLNVEGIRFLSVTSEDVGELYRYTPYLVLEFYKKNSGCFNSEKAALCGIVLNPYLISHPFYETLKQYVPYLYWQMGSPDEIACTFVNNYLKSAVMKYYPEIDFYSLPVWLNSTENFGGFAVEKIHAALQDIGFKNIYLNERIDGRFADEVIADDGITSPAEMIRDELAELLKNGFNLKEWNKGLKYLTLDDIEGMVKEFSK